MDLVLLVRIGYILAISLILGVFLTPPLADRFLSYGPRDTPVKSKDSEDSKLKARSNPVAQYLPLSLRSVLTSICSKIFDPFSPILDNLAKLRVPHAWFRHFYIFSTACTLFWGYQIYTCGDAYVWILGHVKGQSTELRGVQSPESDQRDGIEGLLVAWVLLLIQDVRRFVETIVFVKNDQGRKSSMWIGHWMLGLFFYGTVNIALWIERIDTIETWRSQSYNHLVPSFQPPKEINPFPPYWIIATLIGFFAFYSYEQNRIHAILSMLPSKPPYVMPEEGPFERSMAPHYKAEVVIYSMLFGLSSPAFPKFNVSMGLAWLFVLTNLWVSAWRTKEWYRIGFGDEKVKNKEVL